MAKKKQYHKNKRTMHQKQLAVKHMAASSLEIPLVPALDPAYEDMINLVRSQRKKIEVIGPTAYGAPTGPDSGPPLSPFPPPLKTPYHPKLRSAKKYEKKNRYSYRFGENEQDQYFYDASDDCYWTYTAFLLRVCLPYEDLTYYPQYRQDLAVARDFSGVYSTAQEASSPPSADCDSIRTDKNTNTHYCVPATTVQAASSGRSQGHAAHRRGGRAAAYSSQKLYAKYLTKADRYLFYRHAAETTASLPLLPPPKAPEFLHGQHGGGQAHAAAPKQEEEIDALLTEGKIGHKLAAIAAREAEERKPADYRASSEHMHVPPQDGPVVAFPGGFRIAKTEKALRRYVQDLPANSTPI
eukprot:GHVT01061700.1.p1 GENE.GHVT01061700.1~~GHVT01061700.1.p1  ORF type:complete len:354 (+),score=75.92 GHVT01061700.1:4855-5916(+)